MRKVCNGKTNGFATFLCFLRFRTRILIKNATCFAKKSKKASNYNGFALQDAWNACFPPLWERTCNKTNGFSHFESNENPRGSHGLLDVGIESKNRTKESNQWIESVNRINESNQWIESKNRIHESNQWIESMNRINESNHCATGSDW